MRPDLVEIFISEFHAEVNRLSRGRDAEIAARRKELEQVTRKLDALIEAISEGFRSDGLQAKLAALDSRKKYLECKLTEAPSPAPPSAQATSNIGSTAEHGRPPLRPASRRVQFLA
jgi:hypothetical protein